MNIVLVTGGRDFKDSRLVFDTLDAMKFDLLVHGGCKTGADALADAWAKSREVPHLVYPAPWKKEQRKSGPLRNSLMIQLASKITRMVFGGRMTVVAFPGGRGTEDCVLKASNLGEAWCEVLRVCGDRT